MSDQITYQTVTWAEMKPDIYGGETGDQHTPQWEAETEGDMGAEQGMETIEFSAKHYPPGTRITVEVPCCPECGVAAEFAEDGMCSECDEFDWNAWAEENYS